MREEMVENGVKFLRHPNVQTTPLSERVSFLEQKGMTKEEIQEAIERYQNGDAAGAASPALAAPSASYAQPQQQQMMTQRQQQYPQQPGTMVSAPMAMAAAAPMQQLIRKSRYPPYIRILWTISSLVGAASILGFMWNYAVQSGYVPWLRSPLMLTASKAKEEEEENAKKDETLMTGLTDVSQAIQAQTAELTKLCSTLDQKENELHTKSTISTQIAASLAEQSTNQAIADLKAEVSTLKALLLVKTDAMRPAGAQTAASVTGNVAEATALPITGSPAAATPAAAVVPPKPESAINAKAEKVENILKLIRTQNSLEQLKLAAGILTMYVKNLVENPDVPRYRRIAPGNANFKQKVEPLKHHEDLLKSIGFETNGLNMEWKWHTADRVSGEFDDNLAILRAVLKALQSLTSPAASSTLSLEEIAHQSIEEHRQKIEQKEVEGTAVQLASSSSTSSQTQSTLAPAVVVHTQNHDLESFMARLEKKASISDSFSKKLAESAAVFAPPVSEAAESNIVDDEHEEKAPASSVESASTAGPAYPKSFNEVMEMLQKGEKVPGIKEIEEKLSVDSATYLDSATTSSVEGDEVVARPSAPAKPWEKIQG
uniref:Peroxisomal membrane protein PEX14 n=1 Tax=Globisporangium ultimum (strain ATCC 200006 / CBS 805.95 / DAOM BR144) TaxID=431595 RepID=K3XB39_GLOUD